MDLLEPEVLRRLRAQLVRDGRAPAAETEISTAWITGVDVTSRRADDFSIEVRYVDLRSQRAERWVLDDVRAFATATECADLDELADLVRIELEEHVATSS
jgi:hypothetical protein